MRIAIFTDTFLPQIDGVVTSTVNLAKGLSEKGHKVYIIAPKHEKKEIFFYKNIRVIRMKSIPAFFYEGFKFTMPYSFKLLKFLKKEKIDLVHVQTPITIGFQGIIISKLLKIPLIGTFHTLFADPEYLKNARVNYKIIEKLLWNYAKFFYNFCDLITCPSNITKEELKKHGFEKQIIKISNGIELRLKKNNKNYKLIRKKFLGKDENLLLFVGRVAHGKNIPYLIDCFKLILNKLPKTKLVIIGDGPLINEIRKKIKKDNLDKKVILTGKIPRDKLINSNIYKAFDLFVTASKTETQGISVLEAQANGLVCVGINERGLKDIIIDNYNGFLAKKDDKKDFANKVIKLLTNKKLKKRMVKNTLKEIKKEDINVIVDTWEKVYEKIISNNKNFSKNF
ncbi:MAG: glycosyltransferase [Candidatus Pacearchaeota archaeon]